MTAGLMIGVRFIGWGKNEFRETCWTFCFSVVYRKDMCCRDDQQKKTRKPLTPEQKQARALYLVEYRKKNREKIRKQQSAWYEANKERILVERKEHYQENKESVLAQNAEYRRENYDKIKAQKQQYREENSDKIKAKKKADYWADPEKARELKRIWYQANQEKNRLNRKARYWNNREEILKRRREERVRHKDEVNAKQRASRAKNPEAHYAANKRWEQKNPDKVAVYKRTCKQNRRAAEAGDRITSDEVSRVFLDCEGRCAYCIKDVSGEKWHVEHKQPLSRGGKNTVSNITISCPQCNWKKHNKTVKEFVFGLPRGSK
jgi:5-methylcytosine-specific restriction endonuclease McrA